jgi:hypothetical protein
LSRVGPSLIGLLVLAALSACLPQASRTAAPTGAPGSNPPSEIAAGAEAAKDDGPEATAAADDTSNQPGSGGSMPSGTLAPHPLVPVYLEYKAEGTYCRFEGEATRAMIRGRIYRRELGGSPDAETEFGACGDYCRDKHLQLFYQYQQNDAFQTVTLGENADFQFVVDIDDPKQFGLLLILQMNVANIDPAAPKSPQSGLLINVGSMHPYTENGAPAFCPPYLPMAHTPMTYRPITEEPPKVPIVRPVLEALPSKE